MTSFQDFLMKIVCDGIIIEVMIDKENYPNGQLSHPLL